LAHGEALVTLGDLGVDELDQADLPGLVKEGGDIAETSQADGLGPEG
jgi:hypothetical protein